MENPCCGCGCKLTRVRLARKADIEPAGLFVVVSDDDYSGLLVIKDTRLVVREGGMHATYTVNLRTKPYSPVSVTVSPNEVDAANDQHQQVYTLNSSALVFTPETWDQPQLIVVAAVDDTASDAACSAPSARQKIRHQVMEDPQ